MKLTNKKSRVQRLTKTINPLDRSRKSKLGLQNIRARDVSQDQAVKAAVIAGGLAGLTAASAGISALRRTARARNNS